MREISDTQLNFRKVREGDFDHLGFTKSIEQAYLKMRRPDGFMQKKSFSPSAIGYGKGRCPRYWNYMFNGVEVFDDVDAMGIANMAYGTEAGERIAKLMDLAGTLIQAEEEITNVDPPIRGFIDAIVEFNGITAVAEVKTTKQESFMHRKMGKAPFYNLIQVLIYMKLKNLENGFLLYENKNDQSFTVIPVKMNAKNKKIVDDAFEWMQKVYKAYQANQLPRRPFTQKSVVCKFCPLAKSCWEDRSGDIDISPLEEVKP